MNCNPCEKSHTAATTHSSGASNNNNINNNNLISTETSRQFVAATDVLNTALDDLGLLSTVPSCRQQYQQEKLYTHLAGLTMTDSQPGPSQSTPLNQCLHSMSGLTVMPSTDQISTPAISSSSSSVSSQHWSITPPISTFQAHSQTFPSHEISNNFNFSSPLFRDSKETADTSGTEKENNLFAGFKVLTMNSKFVTSFRNDYSLPHHVSNASNNYQHPVCGPPIDKSKWYHKACLRSIARRKRTRTHPYENPHIESTCQALYEMCINETADSKSSNLEVPSCYRLRTTSLSSGVCGGKAERRRLRFVGMSGTSSSSQKPGSCCPVADDRATNEAGQGLVRSRSMEDLPSALDAIDMKTLMTALIRKKDIESVSGGIQQMCVQDSG